MLSPSPYPTFSNVRFDYQTSLTASNTNYSSPTQTKLIAVAGPDGSLITKIGVIATTTQTSQSSVQLYKSPDAGTTFNILPITASFTASDPTLTLKNFTQPDGTTISETNGLPLKGAVYPSPIVSVSNGQFSLSSKYYVGAAPTTGSANNQTVSIVSQNGTITTTSITFSGGEVFDIIPSYTNTGATSLSIGGSNRGAVRAGTLAVLTGNELVANYPVRVQGAPDNSTWYVYITERLYGAIGTAQTASIQAQGVHY